MKVSGFIVAIALSFASLAAPPYQDWPEVGSATLTWGFWTVYHSKLKSPSGHYEQDQWPLALSIDYQMDIDKDDLLDETDDQWRYLQYDKATRQQWLAKLSELWPDVKENDNLTFLVRHNSGLFFHNGHLLGEITDEALNRAFLAIWLSEKTRYPKLRKQLIAGR